MLAMDTVLRTNSLTEAVMASNDCRTWTISPSRRSSDSPPARVLARLRLDVALTCWAFSEMSVTLTVICSIVAATAEAASACRFEPSATTWAFSESSFEAPLTALASSSTSRTACWKLAIESLNAAAIWATSSSPSTSTRLVRSPRFNSIAAVLMRMMAATVWWRTKKLIISPSATESSKTPTSIFTTMPEVAAAC
ncbi:hypothetical protein GALL_439500 [mine drainage metagenome]|uniref:Uncharacterized protein n=1 Tax=mine drainage metagenome TaxID=410659 RepID=A0A1J5PSC9_9ZZZZ